MKTVCENCKKTMNSYDAIHTVAYAKQHKRYDAKMFCSGKCLAEYCTKEVEEEVEK